jgi:hypothetical protein
MKTQSSSPETLLNPADLDQLGQALITLTKELWVLKDRQLILEAALADAGIVAKEVVDRYQPDEMLKEQLHAERQRLIDTIIDVLTADTNP